MKLNRNYVTPLISLVFLVVGITGVLMFFHLFDGYTEVVHEVLGVFFVVCAVAHIMLNWKPLKMHFKKAFFVPAAWGVAAVAIVLVVHQQWNPTIDTVFFNQLVNAPIDDAFKVLAVEYSEAARKLEANNISVVEAESIKDIWVNNKIDPETVINLILEK